MEAAESKSSDGRKIEHWDPTAWLMSISRGAPESITQPLHWKWPRRVVIEADIFNGAMTNDRIAAVFGIMLACPQHEFELVTWYPDRAANFFEWLGSDAPELDDTWSGSWRAVIVALQRAHATALEAGLETLLETIEVAVDAHWPPSHVRIGVTIIQHRSLDRHIGDILRIPLTRRFISYAPACFSVDFEKLFWAHGPDGRRHGRRLNADGSPAIDQVRIAGDCGRSSAMLFDVELARSAIAQCRAAGVPAYVVRLGSRPATPVPGRPGEFSEMRLRDERGEDVSEWPEDLRVREEPAR